MTPARHVHALQLDELPRGRVTRLLLYISDDGLGMPIRVPILVARGERPGKTLGITAALHGNELNGIPVIHGLLRDLKLRNLKGTVVAAAVVNVPGLLRRRRVFSDGQDLNHLMPGVPDGTGAQVYAHRILNRVVKHLDVLLDLHTASFGRANCLYIRADMTNPVIAEMAYLQRPQIIVHNPPNDRTLRGAAQVLGIPAITVEIGNPHRFQREYIRRSVVGLRAVLVRHGMLAKRAVALGKEPVICQESGWFYTDRGGLLEVLPAVTDHVVEGDVVARLTDVWGEVVKEYRAPHDGVVIGKSLDPVAETGSRIMHLGRVAPEGHALYRREVVT